MRTYTAHVNAQAIATLTLALLYAPSREAYEQLTNQVGQALFPTTWGVPGKKRSGITAIVEIAVGLIIFSTLGFVALTMLQTSSTSGWSTAVATVAVTVTAILASIAVALSFYHYAKSAF